MADNNSTEEKKHEATEQKRKKSRDEGKVARSPDVIKLTLMTVFFLVALLPGSLLAQWVIQKFPWMLVNLDHVSIAQALHLAWLSMVFLTLFMMAVTLLGVASGFVPGGWSASTQAIAPKFNKLNPFEGFKRIFSAKRLTETLKAVLKFILVGGSGLMAFLYWKPHIMALTNVAQPNWTTSLYATVWVLGVCIAATVFIVAVDVPLQAFFHSRELRMTDKELRDETKDTQVRPEVKEKQRQARARAMERQQIADVAKAAAVVVNPAHYAVAFCYRRSEDEAPVVVARGAGRLAAKIRDTARRHGVPIISAPPLARALYYHADIGKPIPGALYRACAEILAYVWRLEMWSRGQSDYPPNPPNPSALAVDDRLDPVARQTRPNNSQVSDIHK